MRAILDQTVVSRESGCRLTAIAAGPSSTRPYGEDNRNTLSLSLEDESGEQMNIMLGAAEIAALARVIATADTSRETPAQTAARLLANHRGVLSGTLIAELEAAVPGDE